MQRFIIASLVFLCFFSTAAMAGGDEAIKDRLAEFKAAWDKHDTHAIAALCTEDSTLINPMGDTANGRAEIEKLITREHAGPFKATTYSYTDVKIQWVTDVVAVVDYSGTVSGIHAPDGSAAPDLVHHGLFVFSKKDGHWLISVNRPYQFMAPPGGAMQPK